MIPRPGTVVHLYINGKNSGTITVHGHDNSWTFGDFAPSEHFSEFAPVFGRWSLLMHVDGEAEPLSEAASEELRGAENAIDRLHARIFVPGAQQWHDVAVVNIDGPLIEWREA